MLASATFTAKERRLAPTGSKRYTIRSSVTGVAIGIPALSISGYVVLNALARVTIPETPNPMSSARS